MEATLDNIQSARPFDQLTLDDVAAARPEITKTVDTMVQKGKWSVPGYKEKCESRLPFQCLSNAPLVGDLNISELIRTTLTNLTNCSVKLINIKRYNHINHFLSILFCLHPLISSISLWDRHNGKPTRRARTARR